MHDKLKKTLIATGLVTGLALAGLAPAHAAPQIINVADGAIINESAPIA